MPKRKLLLAGWLMILMIILPVMAVSAKDSVFSVQYGKMVSGKFINTPEKWNTSVKADARVRTVKVADRNGKRCYWMIHGNDGRTGLVQSGKTFTVRGNVRLTPVWKKIFTVRFWNRSGSAEYTGERITFCKGESWQAPSVKTPASYIVAGWSRTNDNVKADFICGQKYTAAADLNLYAVVRKRGTVCVRFFSQSAGAEYRNLRTYAPEGSAVTLPKCPNTEGCAFLGWSSRTSQLTAEYKAGEILTAAKNRNLYAVFAKKDSSKTYLEMIDGSEYKVVVPDGSTVRFPSVYLGEKKTLQGWSTKKGQTCNPQYLEGDIIPKKPGTYYMVAADSPARNTLRWSTVKVRESRKYAQVYILGDSRIKHIDFQFSDTLKKTKILALGGSKYPWVEGEGYRWLLRELKADNRKIRGKKAVIFCHGINDMRNIDKYVAFYRSKARELRTLGCEPYVMSLNPFCAVQHTMHKQLNGSPGFWEKRTQPLLKNFNDKLSRELDGTVTYLDVNTYLRKTGWPTADLTTYHKADGLHYTLDTNKRIISYASRLLDKNYK